MQTKKQVQQKAIERLVWRNISKNRTRNFVLVLAVMLVAVLMTVMFGAGISVAENMQQADLRMRGSTANAFLMSATSEDMEKIADLEEVSEMGWQQFVAVADIDEEIANKHQVVMTAYDQTEWEKHILPTVSNVTGSYPQDENEVMLSEWTLDKLGIDQAEIGMTIPIRFTTLAGETVEQDFILTGYYKDYIYTPGSTPNSGNTMSANQFYFNQGSSQRAAGNIVVSGEFAETYGSSEGFMASWLIDDRLDANEALELMYQTIGKQGVTVIGMTKDLARSLSVAMLPIACIILIMISGYLLIYNVVNISVLQEMHMYGQLKTLGATTKQLRGIVRKLANLVALIGIPLGMAVGTVFAVIVIPGFLQGIMEGNGYGDALGFEVKISPLIYIFTAVFAYFTVSVSCRKPSRMAAKVSPVEALKFVEGTDKVKEHHSSGGGKLYCMAYRNIFRSKKRAMVTFASLFFGLLIYLVVSTCTYGVDYSEKYRREQPDNFILTNLSFQTDDVSTIENLFDEEIIEEIGNMEGVQEVFADYVEPALFLEADKTLDSYITEQSMYRGTTEEAVSEDFQATAIGLPIEKLMDFSYESTLSKEEIQERLQNGTGIFLTDNGMCDYQKVSGTEISVTDRLNTKESVQYEILGILPVFSEEGSYSKSPAGYGFVNGDNATSFYTSVSGIERLAENPRVQTVRIESDDRMDGEISNQLADLFADTDAVTIDSQLEMKASVDNGIGTIQAVGKTFAVFLIGMGLLNFINVIFTSIYSRQKELAALESIGMTRTQIKAVLTLEGLYYSVITMALLCSLGVLISFAAMQLVKNVLYFAAFGIPILQILGLLAVMVTICILVPNLVYGKIAKESIVERLRKGQD